MKLTGKVVIVTGGARGLGKAYCLRLAQDGAKVVVADKDFEGAQNAAKEIEAAGGESLAAKVDVSSQEDTKRMAEETIRRFGRIDVLINNAAMYGFEFQKRPFTEISSEEWDRMMAVNVKGCFLCSKAVYPQMKKQGKGKIINVTSSSYFATAPFMCHYTTSKGGVVGFTRSLAREVGPDGITVNAIAPGYVLTEASWKLNPDPDFPKRFIPARCIKRDEYEKDLVGTVSFLASDDSDFITGQTILVDGGVSHI